MREISQSEPCSNWGSGDDESQPPTPPPAATATAAREPTKQGNWLIQIQTHLTLDLDHIVPISSCIFPVPDHYSSAKPESFAPQLIAIGPLHHFLNGLMLMETFKLGAAKRAQNNLGLASFNRIVKSLEALAPEIRACYARQLTVTDHVLAWIMCIDGLFLLELLTCNGNIFNSNSSSSSSGSVRSRVLLDPAETAKIQSSVFRDAVKLENQIPIFVLDEILSLEDEMTSSARITIPLDFFSDPFPRSKLVQFCVKISPFPARDAYPDRRSEGVEPRHLLDLLYHLILLMGISRPGQPPEMHDEMVFHSFSTISTLWQAVGKGNQQFVKYITLPVTFVIQLVEIFGISDHLKQLLEEDKSLIPSATKLKSAGVRFNAVNTVRDIGFQPAGSVLSLTELTWRDAPTTGTVLRNLIAYESVARPESPILAGYCELIHSLVRTAEDLTVLADAGVIRFEKKEEMAVMALFKEVGKSGEAKDKRVSETVAGVNGYYNGVLKVKLKATGKKCLQYSWTILTVVAVVVLLGLFTLQTVCQVADCKDLFKISSPGQSTSSVLTLNPFTGGGGGDNLSTAL